MSDIEHPDPIDEAHMLLACREVKPRVHWWHKIKRAKPLQSRRLHFVAGRFLLVGLASNIVDYSLFLLVYGWTSQIFVSTYVARGVSMWINYFLVSRVVFRAGGQVVSTFPKYVGLVIVSGFIVSVLIGQIVPLVGGRIFFAKLAAEGLVFLMNFVVQRWLIFRRARRGG